MLSFKIIFFFTKYRTFLECILNISWICLLQSTNIWSYYGIMIWIDRWVFLRLVVVGGDGTLLEVINGLLTRAQKEAGLDYDKPTCKLKPLEVPIGIIPTGVKNLLNILEFLCLHLSIDIYLYEVFMYRSCIMYRCF